MKKLAFGLAFIVVVGLLLLATSGTDPVHAAGFLAEPNSILLCGPITAASLSKMSGAQMKDLYGELMTRANALLVTRNGGVGVAEMAEIDAEYADLQHTITAYRKLTLDKLAEESDSIRIMPHAEIGGSGEAATLEKRIENALFAKLTNTPPSEDAREFMHKRLIDIGADLLRSQGARVDMSRPDEVVAMMTRGAGYNTTSDFSVLLGSAVNRRLQQLFVAAESGASKIAAAGTVGDFRTQSEINLSSFPKLEKINESGELHFGTLQESGEQYKIASFGKGIAVSFQLLINDDLGGIDRSIRDVAFAVGELKASLIISALTDTTNMSDGKPLFHASHSNLVAVGGAPSVASLGATRLLMRNQTAMDNETVLGLTPKFILVPSALETLTDQLVANISPTQAAEVNPFAGKLEPAVEPRLASSAPWYLFADPALMPVVRFVTLTGFEGPRVETKNSFSRIGSQFRITWHCGAARVGYRGVVKNPGS